MVLLLERGGKFRDALVVQRQHLLHLHLHPGLKFQDSGYRLWDPGFGIRDSGFVLWDPGSGTRDPGFGFRVSRFGIDLLLDDPVPLAQLARVFPLDALFHLMGVRGQGSGVRVQGSGFRGRGSGAKGWGVDSFYTQLKVQGPFEELHRELSIQVLSNQVIHIIIHICDSSLKKKKDKG